MEIIQKKIQSEDESVRYKDTENSVCIELIHKCS